MIQQVVQWLLRYSLHVSNLFPISPQGAPESVLERCNYIRVSGSARVPLSHAVREQLLSTVREWGSGRDTLRCLAMAIRDTPPDIHCLNLENSAAFADYEVMMIMMTVIMVIKHSKRRHILYSML